VTREAV
jgi:hypothetical protein